MQTKHSSCSANDLLTLEGYSEGMSTYPTHGSIPFSSKLGLHALDANTSHWLDSATMSVDADTIGAEDTLEFLANDVVHAVQENLFSQVEQYYVESLKHLFDAGEITFVGLLIRLNNLYPQEMSVLPLVLRARIQAMLRSPQ